MKRFIITCLILLFSGCGEVGNKPCEENIQYFCFYNQTYKVTSCGEDVKSEIVIKGSRARECVSEVVYKEMESL